MITVLVAEANPVVRIGIRSALEENGQCFILGEADNLQQCIFMHATMPADVILLGLEGLCDAGRAALADFCKATPSARMLLHGHARNIADDADVPGLGSAGYLSRDCSPAELRIAVSTVAHGQPYISASFARLLSDEVFRADNLAHAYLTPREMQVFKMLSIGIGIKGIAAQLGLSPPMARMLKARVLAQLPSAEFKQVTQFALSRGFL